MTSADHRAFFSTASSSSNVKAVELYASHNDGFYAPTFSGTVDGVAVIGHIGKREEGKLECKRITFRDTTGAEIATAFASMPLDPQVKPHLVMTYAGSEFRVEIDPGLSPDIVTRFGHVEPLDAGTLAKAKSEMEYKEPKPNALVFMKLADQSSNFRSLVGGLAIDGRLDPNGVVSAQAPETRTGQLQDNANETELFQRTGAIAARYIQNYRW